MKALRYQDVLITLDNCEHVIDATAKLADLLVRSCPKVHVVATSREPLNVDGERVFRVPCMSLPEAEVDGLHDLRGSDAVELFIDRAQARDAAFVLDDETAPIAASICRHLDGIPLAIELAAARVSSMSLQDLDHRLEQQLQILTGGSRTAPLRQQTLHATIAWSYELLNGPEREVLHRMSAFFAGFDLAAAGAVCAAGDLGFFDLGDLVGALVNKSLVAAERSSTTSRYRLLEPVRQFAAAKFLEASGQDEVLKLRRHHADYFLEVCEKVQLELVGPHQSLWLKQLDVDRENILAALSFYAEADDHIEEVLRLCVATRRFFGSRLDREPEPYLRNALDRAGDIPFALRAKALLTLARMMNNELPDEDHLGRAGDMCREALELARSKHDRATEIESLEVLSWTLRRSGQREMAVSLALEALDIADELGDAMLVGDAHFGLGYAQESMPMGRPHFAKALGYFRQAGDIYKTSRTLMCLAAGELDTLEHVGNAWILEEEAIELAESIGDTSQLLPLLINHSVGSFLLGDKECAEKFARRVLIQGRRSGMNTMTLPAVWVLSCCATSKGDFERAATMFGAAESLGTASSDAVDWEWGPLELAMREDTLSKLRGAFGAKELERTLMMGRGLEVERVVDIALGRSHLSP